MLKMLQKERGAGDHDVSCFNGRRTVCQAGFLIAGIFLLLPGCLTSNVRYTRPSHQRMQQKKEADQVKEQENITEIVTSKDITESKLKKIVNSFVGVPYKYGGTTRKGMDCSGFVWRVYSDLGQKEIPRTSSAKLSKIGTYVSQKKIQPGDLVFFRKWSRINHVGIYMGDNTFAHASSKRGVVYTSLDNEYFRNRLVCIRRVK